MCPTAKDGAKTAARHKEGEKGPGLGSFSPRGTPPLELLPAGQAR